MLSSAAPVGGLVVLGARLDVSALLDHLDLLMVTVSLIVLTLVIHSLAAMATRQPLSAGLIATAQLGVPAAVVQIGLQEHLITPALGAAITVAALAWVGLCALAHTCSRAEQSAYPPGKSPARPVAPTKSQPNRDRQRSRQRLAGTGRQRPYHPGCPEGEPGRRGGLVVAGDGP